MPNYFPITGAFFETGTGAPGNDGRATSNLNMLAFDSNNYLYTLKSNGEAASRVAFAPTILDLENTDNRGQVCIQPAAARLELFAGLWAASVAHSSVTDDTDLQWVLSRGSASAAPIESGVAHSVNNTGAFLFPNAGADEMASNVVDLEESKYVDLSHGRFAYPLGAEIASDAETGNIYMSLSPL